MDCEVYALHAARSLKLNLWTPQRWDLEREKQLQIDLLTEPEKETVEVKPVVEEKPKQAQKQRDTFFDAFKRRKDTW